ncbi:ornithine cyclodeaminase family protein [Kaistia algarum]|uniref:ornithine cyclodeaminase family protein n=1 Tax=Kaistia algarum TaxID=2083279 RepID=UPI000CE8FC27|nr:ornithine cyclodeaminase family protein [Kaistia algarum]MCX5513696.1 ornithine cyclodeaminase family protein [Kaistia algarum]PPE79428.1 ornithine cyclodeaminase family protein [Kaistia algarum]
MRVIPAERIDATFDRVELVETLRAAFCAPAETPTRHHHTIPRKDGDATLLLMPAFDGETEAGFGHVGVKIVSVFPGNAARGAATVQGVYLLFSGETGAPLALIDGPRLTLWRTAAASALAADYLARPDASHLVMIGAGAVAAHLVEAHAASRPIERVSIWSRRPEQAEALAARLTQPRLVVKPVDDLEAAVAEADIVSAATLSKVPLVRGALLRPGTHVDLVGGFTPSMREADDDAMRRARVYVDTFDGALAEAGDIVGPIASGVLTREAIMGDLFSLARGESEGRRNAEEITLFKSVGTALEDLAAAAHLWRRIG